MEMIYEGIADTDPFVVEALRKRGANEKCWCLSGKKYKRCHRDREKKKAVNAGQALQVINKDFKVKRCMHPSDKKCDGQRIRAHTIQRKGGLKHIVDQNNKVLMMGRGPNDYTPALVGWKEASTFHGFCSYHDANTFKNLEDKDFQSSPEQCFLLYYRALCYQNYQKEAFVETLQKQKETLDSGLTLDKQINIQLTLNKNIHDYGRTVSELSAEKKDADHALLNQSYAGYSHLIIYFTGNFDLFTTSHFAPAYDAFGCEIYDLYNESIPGEGASFSIVPIDADVGAFVVSWNDKYLYVRQFIEKLLGINPGIILNLMHQLLFAHSENIYFSSKWWESLDETQKAFVKKLHAFGADNYGELLKSEVKLHRWQFKKLETINF